MVTFAVVGHNEERYLPAALGQAAEAARDGEPVWFVDSASTDGSAETARSLGVEVVEAPLGKGRAMAAAIERCESDHICFVDADLEGSTRNIPLALREALDGTDPDMVVAEFDWPEKRLSATVAVYMPLVEALFPEAMERVGRVPFSGFRVLRTSLDLDLPPGYGVETYLNLLAVVDDLRVEVVDVGRYTGAVRAKRDLGDEVAGVILDMAEADGRLDPALRGRWEAWVEPVSEILRTQPESDEPQGDYPERLMAAAGRPLPPAR